jgi:hypothetical protein
MKKKVKNLRNGKFEVLTLLHLSKIKGGGPGAPSDPNPQSGRY